MKVINLEPLSPYMKWDYRSHSYKKILIPSKYNLKIFSEDLNEIVNCAQCQKELPFGESYTSLEIHNHVGFGYCVCENCYEEEWKRRMKYKNEDFI